ncbi:hypothetical protein EHI8A_047030 [Entamoeba histolytica HM-1:IMSS-B]|uniref:TLDc domain-containing protein n=3 Tax=Entamoeba histolytica TaxID=5759 RepID=M3UT46_ENTH1|nr:hypothetical protein EHI8A_047030 [Entamoeba histolytica HM-1:IMSS-B]EMS11348.1 hypothetical protein KM1_103940 [Entamoeba histolytica HM-3:IMSS]ENY62744.1 hypothetical protein EHI7A_042260 [Entamoeba histolytica HM-1:IMSS-A]
MGKALSTPNKKSIIKAKEMVKQLEEWTEKRISNILFDSNNDDWNISTSVFDQRILNKEHIIIIIEDEEGNKFGGYIHSKIDETDERIKDIRSFVFSIKSKGGLFEMQLSYMFRHQYIFYLYTRPSILLFAIGDELYATKNNIVIYKENNKTKSWRSQFSFEDNKGNSLFWENELPEHFIPKRIMVVQMI